MRRKVLLICYYFPPMGLAGVGRPLSLFKGLPRYGYECHVLTVKPVTYWAYEPELLDGLDTSRVYRSGSRDPQRIMHLLGVRRIKASAIQGSAKITDKFFPDSKVGWVKSAVRLGRTIAENNRYDLLISTSPPVSTHLVAEQLSLEFNIPWVADFRDFWSVRPIEETYDNPKFVERGKKLLRDITLRAATITAVNRSIADYVQADHVVPNGYDSAIAQNWLRPPDPSRYIIGIPGSQHRGRLIAPLFEVLDILRQRYPAEFEFVRLLQVGDVDHKWWSEQLAEHFLTDRCDVLGYKPRVEYVRALSKASMMFLGLSDDLDSAMIPSRLFDLLASGRPILASVKADSAVEELIRRDRSGFPFSCDTVDDAVEYLRERTLGFGSGKEVISPLPSYAEEFSSDVMVNKFAGILDTVR